VIRRGFWLAVGAAGGIMGYRRASALKSQVTQTLGGRPRPPGAARRHWARETIRFTRDVRDGMDLYIDRRDRAAAPNLGQDARAGGNSADHPSDQREDH
jgi:hypothetical protein